MRFLVFFILLQLLTVPVPAGATLTQGLIGCYPFKGDAADYSGFSRHGIVQGAGLTSDRFGVPNNAYEFNGVSDYIRLPKLSSYTTSDEFSISVWIQPVMVKLQTILFMMPDNFSDRLNAMAYYSHNGVSSTIWDFGNCTQGGRLIQVGTVFNSSWQHWTFTVHPINGMKVYVNGVLTNMTVQSSFPINRNRELWIGGGEDINNAPFYFQGKIDDLRLYERELTPSEILQVFQLEDYCSPLTGIYSAVMNPVIRIFHSGGRIRIQTGDLGSNSTLQFYDSSGRKIGSMAELRSNYHEEFPADHFLNGIILYILQTGREVVRGKVLITER